MTTKTKMKIWRTIAAAAIGAALAFGVANTLVMTHLPECHGRGCDKWFCPLTYTELEVR